MTKPITDFLGQELFIGDTVIYSQERGKDLHKAKVEEFVIRPKTTKVVIRWKPPHSELYDWGSTRIDPKFLLKVSE